MIKKILLGIGIIVLGIVGFAAMQPADYIVSRELLIQAAPSQVFPYLNESKKIDTWMPWKETDPSVVTTFSGPEAGVGAKSSWTSTGQMGVGTATIIESVQEKLVKTQIEYQKPFVMVQVSDFTITPKDGASLVTWSVRGENGLIGRIMCLFFNMDKMVGPQFEKGLKNLNQALASK